MKLIMAGKGIELTDGIKTYSEEKLSKLDKYFTENTIANVTFKTEKNDQIIEVTIPIKGNVIRVKNGTDDMYKSIDQAVDLLDRQVRKYRTKIKSNKIHNIMKKEAEGNFSNLNIEEDDSDEIKIVKKKTFITKPMDPIEACMQSELIGHNFFMFLNSETGGICAVYKRGDGTFGLLMPEDE